MGTPSPPEAASLRDVLCVWTGRPEYTLQHLKCCLIYQIPMSKVGPKPSYALRQSTVVMARQTTQLLPTLEVRPGWLRLYLTSEAVRPILYF